jgi:hypothetical protein
VKEEVEGSYRGASTTNSKDSSYDPRSQEWVVLKTEGHGYRARVIGKRRSKNESWSLQTGGDLISKKLED